MECVGRPSGGPFARAPRGPLRWFYRNDALLDGVADGMTPTAPDSATMPPIAM